MDRKECYAYLKKNEELIDIIKVAEGKNYTNCKTDVLCDYIKGHIHRKNTVVLEPENINPEDIQSKFTIEDSYVRLLEVLKNKRLIINSEYDYITGK